MNFISSEMGKIMRSHVTVTWMSRDNVVVLTCVGYCHVFKSLNLIGWCTYHVMCLGVIFGDNFIGGGRSRGREMLCNWMV